VSVAPHPSMAPHQTRRGNGDLRLVPRRHHWRWVPDRSELEREPSRPGAAASLMRQHPECHFVLVGASNTSRGEALAEYAASLGLDGRVHFLGARNDIAQLLREMDAFVLPSLSEGMSNALLEAMAAGLPCVATRVGANAEVIGAEGILASAGDAESLAGEIERVVSDPSLCRQLGEAARDRACQSFNLPQMVTRHLELYEHALSARTCMRGTRDHRSAAREDGRCDR